MKSVRRPARTAARTTLSQMDVPTRQALVMTVVTPAERTAAAAVTNAARYTVRPIGPLIAGTVQQLALGAPLVLAGGVKAGYDLALWRWAGRLRPPRTPTVASTTRSPARRDQYEVGHPGPAEDRPDRLPLADQPVHRP